MRVDFLIVIIMVSSYIIIKVYAYVYAHACIKKVCIPYTSTNDSYRKKKITILIDVIIDDRSFSANIYYLPISP